MGKGKIGPNAKQVAGREKKATTLAAKNAVINAANAKVRYTTHYFLMLGTKKRNETHICYFCY